MLAIIQGTIQVAVLVGVVLYAKRRGWLAPRRRDTAGIVVLLVLWLLLVWAVEARKQAGAVRLPSSATAVAACAR